MLLNRLNSLDNLGSGLDHLWGSDNGLWGSDDGLWSGNKLLGTNSTNSSNLLDWETRVDKLDSRVGNGDWGNVGEEGGGSWWASNDSSVGNGHNGANDSLMISNYVIN